MAAYPTQFASVASLSATTPVHVLFNLFQLDNLDMVLEQLCLTIDYGGAIDAMLGG